METVVGFDFVNDVDGEVSALAGLDVATVVEVAQALSAELAFEAVAERLLALAIERSGAGHGVIFLARDGELAPAAGEIAETVATVVRRAAASGGRVVTCEGDGIAVGLPLVHREQLLGVLYLEKDRPFTPRRLAILEIIAALGAISLENARLRDEVRAAKEQARGVERETGELIDSIPALTWSTRPDGKIEFLNRYWLEYTGLDPKDADNWPSSLHPEDVPQVLRVWQASLASGGPGEVVARFRRHDGAYRWFLFRTQPQRDEHGRIVRWCGTNTDIDDLKRAEAALRRSQDFLNEAQRISHTGSFTWDPATGDIGWSRETYRIYEIDPSTKPTLSMVTGRTHPDDVERTRGYLERAARDGLDWQDERRLLMPDGRIKHVHVIAHALHVGGRVTFAGAVKEVTAAKREEERLQRAVREKGAVLKEVHHRVKNNLQFISSLLSLEAARSANRQVSQLFAELRSRLRSMALVHENLYRAGDFGEVPMAAHVARLCDELVRAYQLGGQRVEVTAACGDLHLDMDRAMSCGLIINELVANAFKHAFPEGRSGRVFVDLCSPDGRHCTLTVRDDGVSLPTAFDLGRDGSLGLQLVHDLVEQLHGTVAIGRERGTTFTIDFDADGGNHARPVA